MKIFSKILFLVFMHLASALYAGQAGLADRCLLAFTKVNDRAGQYFGIECEFENGGRAIQAICVDGNAKETLAYDLLNSTYHKITKLEDDKYGYTGMPVALNYLLFEKLIVDSKGCSKTLVYIDSPAMNLSFKENASFFYSKSKPKSLSNFCFTKKTSSLAEKLKVKLKPITPNYPKDSIEREEKNNLIAKVLDEYKSFRRDKDYIAFMRIRGDNVLSLDLVSLENGATENSMFKMGDNLGEFSFFTIDTSISKASMSLEFSCGDNLGGYKFLHLSDAELYDFKGDNVICYFEDDSGVLNIIFSLAMNERKGLNKFLDSEN